MKKYSKKIALILALALTLALAIPALAAQTNISGSYMAQGTQVINVVVSGGSTVKAFLNPKGYNADVYSNEDDAYRVMAEATGEESDFTAIGQLEPSGDITTMPIVGVNLGGSPVRVRAAVVSTLVGNFKFASSAPSQKSTSGLVFLEAKALGNARDNSAYDLEYDTTTDKDMWWGGGRYDDFNGVKVLDALNNWNDHDEWINNNVFTDKTAKTAFTQKFGALKKTNQYIDKTKKELGYQDEIVVLKKGTVESKQQLCTVPQAQTVEGEVFPSYFIARLSGRLGEGVPTDMKKMWTANDGFGASIIWTFQTVG